MREEGNEKCRSFGLVDGQTEQGAHYRVLLNMQSPGEHILDRPSKRIEESAKNMSKAE